MHSLMVLFFFFSFLFYKENKSVAYKSDCSQYHKLNEMFVCSCFSDFPFLKVTIWVSILKYSGENKEIKHEIVVIFNFLVK
jgi:hypothetical protein